VNAPSAEPKSLIFAAIGINSGTSVVVPAKPEGASCANACVAEVSLVLKKFATRLAVFLGNRPTSFAPSLISLFAAGLFKARAAIGAAAEAPAKRPYTIGIHYAFFLFFLFFLW
jgi:hypothetical protein